MSALTGQVALITGASAPNGIGQAIARRLAVDGAYVVVTDIDRDGHSDLLANLAADIRAQGGLAGHRCLDVTQEVQVLTCVDEIVQDHGRIDILVNNAGSLAGADAFLSTTAHQWMASFEVNLLGPMMLSHATIPHMQRQQGGRIINIGSTGSLGAEPGFGAYTTMKHGLIGFTKTLAAEFGGDGIRCNAVCPGYIATDMHMAANDRLARAQGVSIADIKKARYEHVPLGDAGLPEDVAYAVAYLAGPQAKYVTGVSLPVTGGVPFGI